MLTKQEKYSMDIKNIAKSIRQELVKLYPACIFSIKIERYSMGQSMTIALMKAPFEALNKEYTQDKNGNSYQDRKEYGQLNPYIFRGYAFGMDNDGYNNGYYLTIPAYNALKKAVEIADYYNYDDSEPQTDYFDVNFYLNIEIGKWDKPFEKIS